MLCNTSTRLGFSVLSARSFAVHPKLNNQKHCQINLQGGPRNRLVVGAQLVHLKTTSIYKITEMTCDLT